MAKKIKKQNGWDKFWGGVEKVLTPVCNGLETAQKDLSRQLTKKKR